MKLTYYDSSPNFGDDLNEYVWPRILPKGFLDDDESELFLGIGSILWNDLPKTSKKFILGSGYGGYTPLPDISDGSWDIQFLRGPSTAKAVGADIDKVICDSAILLKTIDLPKAADRQIDVAFMPHRDSLDRGNWPLACKLAGIHFIDPTEDHKEILAQLLSTKLLIAEAMHGAIVADTLRIPWVAVEPIHPLHRFKWYDWAAALDIEYRPQKLTPSSSREMWTALTGMHGGGLLSRSLGGKIAFPINYIAANWAASTLIKLSKCQPQLSSDSALERALDRALTVIDDFVRTRRAAA